MENGHHNGHTALLNGTSERYYIGIEGGASHSQGVLLNESAVILAKCSGDGTNQWVVGLEKACETIADMVKELRQTAEISESATISGLGLCMSGADDAAQNKQWVDLLDGRYRLATTYAIENDTVGSLATARQDLTGVVLISGERTACWP